MHSLLLFNANDAPIAPAILQSIFDAEPGFVEVRRETSMGTPIEVDFHTAHDFTIVRLARETISIRGTEGAALEAVVVLCKYLPGPLRLVDTDYSFDLILPKVSNSDELREAISNASTDPDS